MPISPLTPSTAGATTEAAVDPALGKRSAGWRRGPSRKLLTQQGIRVLGYVKQVGPILADIPDPAAVTLEQVESNPVRCPVPESARLMQELIEQVRKEQDSIGGVCELVATGVPAGLGEPVFDKLKADLGKALLSLPAVLAFEYGAGFAVATARGSATTIPSFLDRIGRTESARPATGTAACWAASAAASRSSVGWRIKPTSSLPRPQQTVTRSGEPTQISTRGRHDPCLLPRFVSMGEAMFLLVLADHWLRFRAQCGP